MSVHPAPCLSAWPGCLFSRAFPTSRHAAAAAETLSRAGDAAARVSGTHTVILGAGFGGLACAAELAQALPPGHRVTLVDEKPSFLMGTTKLWLLDGRRRLGEGEHAVRGIERLGVRFLQGRVTRLDPATRTVEVGAERLVADHLVIALGASLAPDALPGLAEGAHNLYTPQGAARAHEALAAFQGGDVLVLVSSMPFKCPPAPYEAAMLAKAFLEGRGVQARVSVASPEPQPLPVAGPECGATVREWLTERGVEALNGHKPVSVDPSRKEVRFENGVTRRYDLLVAVPPHRAPALLREAGLVDESGWVPVDPATLATRVPGVWAIGDCTFVKLANGKPLVKAGVMAEGEGVTIARNIASSVRGEPETARFDGKGGCYLELGRGEAVEVVGDFYATPNPIVVAKPPSKASLEGKKRFEAERIARWLGG